MFGQLCARRLLLCSALLLVFVPSKAWQQCSEEAGGGTCPNRATCCPTEIPGVSGCISGRAKDPPGVQGECCTSLTGCSYGYSCDVLMDIDVTATSKTVNDSFDVDSTPICKRKDTHPDYLNAPITKRYELCRLSPDVALNVRQLNGFPVTTPAGDYRKNSAYHLGYYSSLGSITMETTSTYDQFASIETILVIVHGSGRSADDYLCAGLSVVPHSHSNVQNVINDNYNKYLVIAPLFAAPSDTEERSIVENLLYWADKGETVPLGHTWRYGADALNYNISSYGAIDSMIEYFIKSRDKFQSLQQIVVAGHSAGGQVAHRWALLSSSSSIWLQNQIEIRVVVANPRSYCYLDDRRVLFYNSTNNTDNDDFAVPSKEAIDRCPSYSQWQWGLEPGGDVVSHYKERILNTTSPSQLANRYGARKVFYLSGELDVIEQMDRCETRQFQGLNRNHRARNYFKALNVYFAGDTHSTVQDLSGHRHELHIIPGSPHDHFLMFQSSYGRRSLFGEKESAEEEPCHGHTKQQDNASTDIVKYEGETESIFQNILAFLRRSKGTMLRTSLPAYPQSTIRVRNAQL